MQLDLYGYPNPAVETKWARLESRLVPRGQARTIRASCISLVDDLGDLVNASLLLLRGGFASSLAVALFCTFNQHVLRCCRCSCHDANFCCCFG